MLLTTKSEQVIWLRYVSMSNPFTNRNSPLTSSKENTRDAHTIIVLPVFLCRLAIAILTRPPLWTFLCFRVVTSCSIYLVASIGDTLDAILAGCTQEIYTVIMEKIAAPINMTGEKLYVTSASVLFIPLKM